MEISRIVVYFSQIGIYDVVLLGRIKNTKSQPPVGLHIHKGSFEVCYHSTGSQYYTVNNEDYIANGGDVFITLPNERHSTGTHCQNKSYLYFFVFKLNKDTKKFMDFDEQSIEYIKYSLFNLNSRLFKGTNKFGKIFDEIISIYFSQSPMKIVRIKGLISDFFFQLIECTKNHKVIDNHDMNIIKTYIDNNTQEHFTVEILSSMAFLSQSRFKQKFKEFTGMPPIEYAIRAKIELSKSLLIEGSLSLINISMKLGFSSSQHFSTVFKKYVNLTPKEFYKLNK